jgi:hypothetical protein
MAVKKNSFISLMEDISILNKNIVEIVAKINTVVSSTDSTIQFTLFKPDGNQSTYNMPTVGYLERQINNLNNNIKRLSTFNDNTSLIIDGKSIKRIYTTDLNSEPSPMGSISNINTFEPVNNHFFESLMNPLLSVNIDLTDKVNESVNGVLVRRYMIKFERNIDDSLTENGLISYNDYINRFSNRNDISITEFTDWYYNPTNYGVTIDTVQPYDEQIYDLSLNRLNSHGVFSVIKTEIDSLNKKYWYHLNTLKYYNVDGSMGNLTIGDELILNRVGSSTRWMIKEINTQNSLNMVVFERVDGYEPVPVGTDILKLYSEMTNKKSVKINVGFAEHNVLFIKPINKDTNIVSNIWSKGISFYTNDLMLSTNQNMRLSEYYINTVYDYGKILEDMVLKKIPTKYGQPPNTVILDNNNFKVVQINDHLTSTSDSDILKELQSQKIRSKTKLSEYDNAIITKNQDINSTLTNSERIKLSNDLQNLYTQQESEGKNLSSIVNKINSVTNNNIAIPKFRLRGFWSIPDPIISNNTQPQHVVQFRIQYRYSSKDGKSPSIKGFSYNQQNIIPQSSSDISSVSQTNVSSTSEYLNTNTAYFSNWVEFLTDVRKRYWDEVRGNWYWKIEDVSNADTPNINQLDIPINKNEKIEIRIKAISEVGWPDSLIESQWSNTLVVSFPDDLNDVMNENSFILQEASSDSLLVSVTNELNSKGVYTHIKDSFYIGNFYYPHTDRNIAVTFKDNNGNILTLFEYLTYLTNKINELEGIVKSAKGELRVMLYWKDINGSNKSIEIKNNDIKTINIQCEDYGTLYTDNQQTYNRRYINSIYNINSYYIMIENLSPSNSLGLLSSRLYNSTDSSNTFYKYPGNKATVLDQEKMIHFQQDNQFIWFSDNSSNNMIYSGTPMITDNQIDVLRDVIYNYSSIVDLSGNYIIDIANQWKASHKNGFASTVHPMVNQMSDLVDTGQAKTKYINNDNPFRINVDIYFKYDISGTTYYQVPTSPSPTIHTKKLKCFIETYSLSKPFEFELNFKLYQFRTYRVGTTTGTNIISGSDDVSQT